MAMSSMTGFGRGDASNGAATVVVEMKSVNNRFRDLQVRVPREYQVYEPRVHALLKDRVQRGRLEVFIRRASSDGSASLGVDLNLAQRVHAAAVAVAQALGRTKDDVPLSLVLAHPGVLDASDVEPDVSSEWDLLETAVEAALQDLLHMRAVEGKALEADLRQNTLEILRLRGLVAQATQGIVERLEARLKERLARLVQDGVDPKRLAQEAAVLADKADVSEELTRIQAHCDQFLGLLTAEEPVGRKLDFLLQELNREINTVGSKAAEHAVSAQVVEMKSVLEKLREQAANVE